MGVHLVQISVRVCQHHYWRHFGRMIGWYRNSLG